ncbi:hypothetical protein B0T25DRAFT_8370 [Lasiosphaeria hispida]|uniref:Mucin-7 n=1 Tax=Lasiosphaeria hispida TaxID=260671 RepID=A0AAJ0HTN6_9PEZI|nr:hypothetical protein B0T25DRAFT_8370 [Lasiosphaeria hispida]
MSAVKNLRAMFEQKGETSPPDRGRSPGIPPTIGSAGSVGSESPRPLSKVRTNFIAIEKDGRIGLQRETSQDSIISPTRKLSGETDIASPTPPSRQENVNIFAEAMARTLTKTNLQDQPIPESPRTDLANQATLPPVKTAQDSSSEAPAGASRRFNRPGADGAADKPVASGSGSTSTAEAELVNGTTSGKEKEKANGKEVAKPAATRTTTRAPPKPLAAPPASKSTAKPAKSPTVSKAPKSPATTSTSSLPAKTPDRNARQPEKTEISKPAISSARLPGSASIKRPPPLQPSPSSSGFVKPKPKSPTRPVRLPAGLTTHTAASGSKVNAPRQSLSRASGVIQTIDSLARSPSRASVSTTATSATKSAGAQSLKRQRSTINRPRPSLGPPPKQPAKDYPPTRKEKEVDESFLARMMRPTQASSSKTTEKLPVTPPRKPSLSPAARRPATRTEGKFTSRRGTPKAVVVNSASGSGSGPGSGSHEQLPSAASQVAVVTKPSAVETKPTTDEIKPATVEAEQAVPVEPVAEVVSPTEENVDPAANVDKTTAEEVAPVVEQAATAEEAIRVAKEIEGEIAIPEPPRAEDDIEKTPHDVDELVAVVRKLSLEDVAIGPEVVNGHYDQGTEVATNGEVNAEEPTKAADSDVSSGT